MNIKTLGDKIAVRAETLNETESGIVLTTEQKTGRGTVVAIGKGTFDDKGKFKSTVVKEGDQIVFSKEGGEKTNIDGEEFTFIKEEMVLAVIKDDE